MKLFTFDLVLITVQVTGKIKIASINGTKARFEGDLIGKSASYIMLQN